MALRLLFLSDTHLGFDLPARPRVERRRRGDDFFESLERALAPAFGGEADLVVHGGDLFFRSRIAAWLAERVFSRLADLADAGADVFWVPGNHERSGVARSLFLSHPRIRVFDRPRTFVVERDGVRVALAGFPYESRVRSRLPELLDATGYRDAPADVRLLCIHQAVEGATVGPNGFVFRGGDDVIRGRDLPTRFAAVLSGHIHRHQVLERDLAGRPLAAPVLYAGSTERTSFAERDEAKGALLLKLAPNERGGAATWEFRELPARPMVDLTFDPGADALERRLRDALCRLDPRSVVRIHLAAEPPPEARALLTTAALHAAAPPGMNVAIAWRGRAAAISRTASRS